MRIALLQLDPVVGDIDHNVRAIVREVQAAAALGAELCITSELAVCGYPPRDLLGREGFIEACERALLGVAAALPVTTLVGCPRRDPSTGMAHNSVALVRSGRAQEWYDKQLLPTYDVFDERRYFHPGSRPLVFEERGQRIGVLVCEDLWRAEDVPDAHVRAAYGLDPVQTLAREGLDLLCVPSASPFRLFKWARQHEIVTRAAERCGCPVAHVNQAGANDDVIFEGQSAVVHASGEITLATHGGRAGASFAAETIVVDADGERARLQPREWPRDLFGALCCAIEGYVRKTGHDAVLLGVSGGIDSAVVAALCVRALGAGRVRGVMMPSRYSSAHSMEDARALAAALGMAAPDLIPIEAAHETMSRSLGASVPVEGLTDENLQSRLRGLTIMTLSNATGSLVVSTGNKSELATGYATLYGDMCGSIAPLGDVLKTQVFELARWINLRWQAVGFAAPPIPQRSIDKPPSAELRPDQTDQDSLPPYELLDAIVSGHVDRDWSPQRIAGELGIDEAIVVRWCATIDRNQFKRAQAPVVPKVSQRAFGPGRRMPLAARASLGWMVSGS
ncbi:MAG: NAD+ synthase [Planctomycetota bacterium]|nr:NAD+ synthase [Planctomycetota bacterium]